MSFLYYFLPGLLAGLLVDMAVRRLSGPYSPTDSAGSGEAEAQVAGGAATPPEGEAGTALLAALDGRDWRRVALVLLTALIIGAVGLRYSDPTQGVIVAVYAAVLLTCTATDLIAFRIPNAITYPAIVLALVAAALIPEADLKAAAAGGAVAGGFMLAIAIISRGGLGLGDVKLATFAGLALGVPFIYPALFLMATLGALVAVALLLLRLRGKGDPIPYAPVLAAATLVVFFWRGSALATL